MPFVEVSTTVRAPQRAVYESCKDMEALAEFMADAESVTTLETYADGSLTHWKGRLKGRRFEWTERETFDDQECAIHYEQTEGDLKSMAGDWTFEPVEDGTEVRLTCQFEFGMPVLAKMLNPLAKMVVRDNLQSMLDALQDLVAAT